jgi:hypothetical protein
MQRKEISMTKSMLLRLYTILLLAVATAGCEVVGGIFKAGVWVGVILAIIVVGGLLMLFRGRG